MKSFIGKLIALIVSVSVLMNTTAWAQNEVRSEAKVMGEGISLQLQNVTMARALSLVDSLSVEKRIQFIYDELEDYRVTNSFYNVSVDDAVRQVVGYSPMRVLFTPEFIFVESAEHEGESMLDSLMSDVSRMVELEEVSVKGQHLVFDHGSYLSVVPKVRDVKASSRGLVLLATQQLPGLRVDVGLESITINGGQPILMINGKERSKERVVNLDPDKILRIEYSNHPSVRYLNRGASGIINFVLKEPENGGSVVVSGTSAVNTGFVNGYAMATYNKGSHELALEYNMQMRDYEKNPTEQYSDFLDPRLEGSLYTEMNNPFYYIMDGLTFEYTYQPSDSTMFVASLNGTHVNRNQDGNGSQSRTITDESGIEDVNYQITQQGHNRMLSPSLDLFLSHKLANRQKLEFNIVGQYNSDNSNRMSSYLSETGQGEEYHTEVSNHGYAVSGEGVYSKSWNKIEARMGLQFQHNFARNEYLGDTNSELVKDNTYLYAEIQGPLTEKLFYSLGTGMKYFEVSNRQWNKEQLTQDDQAHYLRNISTLNLNYTVSPCLSLQFQSQFLPGLPSLSQLSPVMQVSDRFSANMGNENLTPSSSLNNHLTIRYWNEKSNWYINLTPTFNYTHSPITTTTTYLPLEQGGIYVSHPDNGDYYNYLGVAAEMGINNLWGHVNLSIDGTLKQEHTEGTTMASQNGERQYSLTHTNFNSNISLNCVWEHFVAGCYFTITPEWSLRGEMLGKSEMGQNIYAQYRLKGWTFSLDWHCPFNSHGYSYETKNLNTLVPWHHKNWTRNNANMIALGVVFKTNFGKSFEKGQKTLHNGGYDSGTVR